MIRKLQVRVSVDGNAPFCFASQRSMTTSAQFHFASTRPPTPNSATNCRLKELSSQARREWFRLFLPLVFTLKKSPTSNQIKVRRWLFRSFLLVFILKKSPTISIALNHPQFSGTFRKFKEKFAHQNPSAPEDKTADKDMEALCANIKVGDRCQVEPGEKRGVVKFVGRAEALGSGFWVGVQYDEPLGKHDGTVKGTQYFNCPPGHGAVVRPDRVKVGDYPEQDPFEEDEI